MPLILLLHIVVEAAVAFFFLFYPEVGDLIPGFGDGEGSSHYLLVKMYGLAAAFLAVIGIVAYRYRKVNPSLAFLLCALLSGYHFLMSIVQVLYNPDSRAALLHFLLGIFLAAIYVRREDIIAQMKDLDETEA